MSSAFLLLLLSLTSSGRHWAFRPPVTPPIPTIQHPKSKVRNPIDSFLLVALAKKGLSFAPEAEKRVLLRRVTYDLIGLPPTPKEVEDFLADTASNAYEKVVERLLADPRYGERWARHWLDTAGYAESEGILQEDLVRPNAWRYRDYVIRSLNADKPYDRFVREQIAGDELTDYRKAEKFTLEIVESLTATGFLRTAVDATRDDFNTHQFTEYQYRMLHDTETIVVSSVMGVTLQCARCHDHKYEPLTQRDYYRVESLFTGAIRPKGKLLPSRRRQIVAATEADQKLANENNAKLDVAIKEIPPKHPDYAKLKEALEKKRVVYPEIRALYDQDATPPPNNILLRGEWTKPGETVEPGIPAVLDDPRHPFTIPTPLVGATSTGRRRAFAEWLTRPDNPLTARVIVNRLWAQHFGVGIVASVENLGRSGIPPTHPELLDWLASNFVAKGNWSLKKLHWLMVTSTAYRQSSAWRADAAKVDSENRLLWRQRSRRLEAEAMRDGMLAVCGNLDSTMFGEPVGTEERPTGEIVTAQEEKTGRRSLYILVRRSVPVTLMNVFDAPVMETNCTRRLTSTTATQALALMNSSFLSSQAIHFAQRLLQVKPPLPSGRIPLSQEMIALAYQLALSRPPTPREKKLATEFLQKQFALYDKPGKPSGEATEKMLADFCQALLSSNEFVYVD